MEDEGKGGLALILGGASPEGDSDPAESAFKALQKALDSGNAAKGVRAFKELLDACDTDEDESEEDSDEAAADEDDDLGL